jgi:hypothetical protein
MASEIWSAILSGWPSVTDSEVKRKRFFWRNSAGKLMSPQVNFESLRSIREAAYTMALYRGLT